MEKLRSQIPHIALLGDVNSGKSTLLNSFTNQEVSITSDIEGTTTDPVYKRMELLDYGPVVLIDTAGLNDRTSLADARLKQTTRAFHEADLWLIIADIKHFNQQNINRLIALAEKYKAKYCLVFNKVDLVNQQTIDILCSMYPKAFFVSAYLKTGIAELHQHVIDALEPYHEPMLVCDILQANDIVVLVTPIDSEAPKGRIILPQVQVLRECLDNNIITIVVQVEQLAATLKQVTPQLVITDSQAFAEVSRIVPKAIALTSFSIIFARHKGDLATFLSAIDSIEQLTTQSKILIAESCSHNTSHEDIGLVKIPHLLEQKLGFKPNITHKMGRDFPAMIEDYDLVIHCGSCMLNRQTMQSRITDCNEQGILITNYGVLLAYLTGILERVIEPFNLDYDIEKTTE